MRYLVGLVLSCVVLMSCGVAEGSALRPPPDGGFWDFEGVPCVVPLDFSACCPREDGGMGECVDGLVCTPYGCQAPRVDP